MNKLNHHLRQYRHNNDDGLIMGYEQEGTEAFVCCLEQEIAELKAMVDHIKRAWWPANEDIQHLFHLQPQNHNDGSYLIDGELCYELQKAITQTPQQCLSSVKADAVDSFLLSYANIKFADGHGDEAEDVSKFADAYTRRLREGKS